MKKLMNVIIVLILTSCSSTPRNSAEVAVDDVEKDYVLRERHPNPAPEWASNFSEWKDKNDGKGVTFFMGESDAVSDRISGCELASLESKKRIAQEIATLISAKIAATKQGQLVIDKDNPKDPGLRRHFEETVAGKSMAFLTGLKQHGVYWEERNYSANNNGGKKRVYLCSVVTKIDDKDMMAALRRTANRTADIQDDPEAKAVVKEALKDIDAAFREYASQKDN